MSSLSILKMDPEKQHSSRPIVMPKPRRRGGTFFCDSVNSITQEIISSPRRLPAPRRRTMGSKTPAKESFEGKKVITLNLPVCTMVSVVFFQLHICNTVHHNTLNPLLSGHPGTRDCPYLRYARNSEQNSHPADYLPFTD